MKKRGGKKSRAPVHAVAETSSARDAGISQRSAVRSESDSSAAPASPATTSAPTVTSFPILLAHFTWYMLGPLFLFLMLLGILRAGTGWITALDTAFFIVLALTLLCRFLEQRSGQAVGMSGEPSTWADFRRYAVGLPLLAIALWIAANVLGNHWFQGSAGF